MREKLALRHTASKAERIAVKVTVVTLCAALLLLAGCANEIAPASNPYTAIYEVSPGDFSTYSEYAEWLSNGRYDISAESSQEEFDASVFLAQYAESFYLFRELINNEVSIDGSDNESFPYARVITDRLDTKKGIESFLSEFMSDERVREEMEFLSTPTTADGRGLAPYIFIKNDTYMNTEIKNAFYPGVWDVSRAELLYKYDRSMCIRFSANDDGRRYTYIADFEYSEGQWLLCGIAKG